MSSANPERGEIDIVLDGKTYGLRPSYDAIGEIERETGAAITELAAEADALKMGRDRLAVIVACLMRAWAAAQAVPDLGAAKASPAKVGRLIMEAKGGYAYAQRLIATVLWLAATGGYDAEGEPRAAEATAETTPPAPAAD